MTLHDLTAELMDKKNAAIAGYLIQLKEEKKSPSTAIYNRRKG